jgi:hypothetical protein
MQTARTQGAPRGIVFYGIGYEFFNDAFVIAISRLFDAYQRLDFARVVVIFLPQPG